jgi:hypothetical protein
VAEKEGYGGSSLWVAGVSPLVLVDIAWKLRLHGERQEGAAYPLELSIVEGDGRRVRLVEGLRRRTPVVEECEGCRDPCQNGRHDEYQQDAGMP